MSVVPEEVFVVVGLDKPVEQSVSPMAHPILFYVVSVVPEEEVVDVVGAVVLVDDVLVEVDEVVEV